MIDFHCHIDLYPDPSSVVRDCIAKGMYVLSVTTTPSAWAGTSHLASSADRIQTSLGLHPELAHQRSSELPLFDELLLRTKYVGEVGLDGSPGLRQHWEDQKRVFEHILGSCSRAGGRVLTVHSRRAAAPVLDALTRYPDSGTPVLHWFSGSLRDLERAIAMGCWFSVGPAMLQSNRGQSILSYLPKRRTLTETDGPFVRIGDNPVVPSDVALVEEALTGIWRMPLPEVRHTLLVNLRALTTMLRHMDS